MGRSGFDDTAVEPSTTVQELEARADAVPGATAPDASDLAAFLDADALTDAPETEGYWVREPFAYVSIGYDADDDTNRYRVVEPVLDDFERYVRDDLAAVVRNTLLDEDLDPANTSDDAFREHVRDVLADHADLVPGDTLLKLAYYFDRDFTGVGPLDPFMRDANVEDVSCDGDDVPLYVYLTDYGHVETNRQWGADRLRGIVRRVAQAAGRHVSAAHPLTTTTLPDGSRAQITLGGDVATRGSNFTIRKFSDEPFTPIDLVQTGTFTVRQLAYLWLAIEYNASVVFAGPTASGKTTSMNATSLFVPPGNKVVSIEETREVNLPHDNWIASVTREADLGAERPTVDTYELLSEALHQRPDHILVGEIRTTPEVARTFFQAVGTGHAGFTTFHAESGADAVRRLAHAPLDVPPELLNHLDVVAVQHLLREDDERIRRVRTLQEVEPTPDPDQRPTLRDVFSYDPANREFAQVGPSTLLADIAEDQGWSRDRLVDELHRRQRVLHHLVEQDVTDYETVSRTLFRYARNPDRVLQNVPDATPRVTPLDVADDD